MRSAIGITRKEWEEITANSDNLVPFIDATVAAVQAWKDSEVYFPFRPKCVVDVAGHVLKLCPEIEVYTLLRLLYQLNRVDAWRQCHYVVGGRGYKTFNEGIVVGEASEMIFGIGLCTRQPITGHELWKEHFLIVNNIVTLVKQPSGGSLSQYVCELIEEQLPIVHGWPYPEDKEWRPGQMHFVPLSETEPVEGARYSMDDILKDAREATILDAYFGPQDW